MLKDPLVSPARLGLIALALGVIGCAPSLVPPPGPGAVMASPQAPSASHPSLTFAGVPDPRGLAIDAQGDLYLTNGASGSAAPAGRVLKLAPDGSVLAQADLGTALGPAVLDASGSLWTTSAGTLWKLDGQTLATTSYVLTAGSLPAAPKGIAIDASGSLWVAEASNSMLLRFHDGAEDLRVSIPAAELGAGAYPAGVLTASGSVWVSCVGSPRLYKRQPLDGSDAGHLDLPAMATGALGSDKNGLLWAAHLFTGGTKAAAKFSNDLALKQDYDVDQDVPTALVGDARGFVWALLKATSRVARLTPADGSSLVYQNDALARPAALAVDALGDAWVASPGATGSIAKIPASP